MNKRQAKVSGLKGVETMQRICLAFSALGDPDPLQHFALRLQDPILNVTSPPRRWHLNQGALALREPGGLLDELDWALPVFSGFYFWPLIVL